MTTEREIAQKVNENFLDPDMLAEVLQDMYCLDREVLRNLGKLLYHNNLEGIGAMFAAIIGEGMDAHTLLFKGLEKRPEGYYQFWKMQDSMAELNRRIAAAGEQA